MVTTTTPGRFTTPGSSYRGVSYGRPWPGIAHSEPWTGRDNAERCLLADIETKERIQKLIWYTLAKRDDGLPSEPIVNELVSHPAIVPDVQLVLRYINCLKQADIDVRVLLCATTAAYRVIDAVMLRKLLDQSTFLGFDYVDHDLVYSVLADDLEVHHNAPCPSWLTREQCDDARERLAHVASLRNMFGLLDNEGDLLDYIHTRWDVATKTTVARSSIQADSLLEVGGEFWPCEVREVKLPLVL